MNISKREKILVSLAFLAVLWMGISFLFSGKEEEAAPAGINEKPAEEFLMEVAQSLAAYQLTKTEKLILEKAEASWPLEPFVSVGTPTAEDTSNSQAQASAGIFVYAGFIQVGSRPLAIINGTEYGIGDPLADAPLTVRGISSERVVLEDSSGRRIAVPIVDALNRSAAPILHQSQ
jgi:hypothetical protein